MRGKKKERLYIDASSLTVTQHKPSWTDRLLKMSGYVLTAALFFGLALLVSYYFLEGPKERRIRHDLYESAVQYRYLDRRLDQLTEVLEDLQQRDRNLYRIIFDAEPPHQTKELYRDYSRYADNALGQTISETSYKADALASAIYAQSVSLDSVYEMAKTKQQRLEHMPAILPINKKDGRVVSGFGPRYHPIFKNLRQHTGIDITAARGVPIYATGDGIVEKAGANMPGFTGYGVCCVVNHGFGYKTLYAHMDKLAVRQGMKVKRGDRLGTVGTSGYATGPHLHYEVHVNGKHVNPVYYFFIDISPEEYLEILEKSREINQSLS